MIEIIGNYANLIGIIGVIIVLFAYFLLNAGHLKSSSMYYLVPNLVGSILILISLFYFWNLASVIIEIAWIIISVMGIIRVQKTVL